MYRLLERDGTVSGLSVACAELTAHSAVQGLLILAADGNNFAPAEVDPLLISLDLPVFGAVFPEIIFDAERFSRGTIVVGLQRPPQVYIIPGLSDAATDFDELIDQTIPETGFARTALVLVDGFSIRIGALLEGIFNTFGLEVNYLGGGAGSMSMQQKPCLFSNRGMLEDQALIALLDEASGVGVTHGWSPLAGPFEATECEQNVIKSIDWQPAFEFYRTAVRQQTGQLVQTEAFYDTAQNYPFGLSKLDAEMLVRDPFAVTAEGHIICVGEVPRNSYLHILTTDNRALVTAAADAVRQARDNYPADSSSVPSLVFDCISRSIFMRAQFREELAALQRETTPLIGALTIGEIANNGKTYLELFNKTSVVGLIDL